MIAALCLFDEKPARSKRIAKAMAIGIVKDGDQATVAPFGGLPPGMFDVTIAYGWRHPHVFDQARQFVFCDLGYWNRDATTGYNKVIVGGRDPSPYFRRNLPADRIGRLGIQVQPWRPVLGPDAHILIAGHSEKHAGTLGYRAQQWESETIAKLRAVTRRPLVYRPKPSWIDATPIDGAKFSRGPLADDLANCWAAVSHASNVAVDALIAGIPVYVEAGPAKSLSIARLEDIESPTMPDGREQLLADLAYQQWTLDEMRSGECWRHLKQHTPLCQGTR